MKIEIPIVSTKYRGFSAVYPIKLMYVSNIPVILASALTANAVFHGADAVGKHVNSGVIIIAFMNFPSTI